MLLIIGVIAGGLFQQKYLTIPENVSLLSVWYSGNVVSAFDALLALALGGWEINLLGFKSKCE